MVIVHYDSQILLILAKETSEQMKHLLSFFLLLTPYLSGAQNMIIKDFVIKENLSQNGKLAVIAVDSLEKADDHIRGTFIFSVNGFQQILAFEDGVAVLPNPIESSTFVFFKHKNQETDLGKFYFIRKTDKGLAPHKLSGLMFIFIPAAILFIGYLFKRFLFVFALLAVAFIYFHYSKGLDVSQVLESFFFSLKNLI